MDANEAINHYIPQIAGWSTPEKCKTLFRCIKQVNENSAIQLNSLEIGIYGGRGLISMGFAHRELNNGSIAIGLDPWSPAPCFEGQNDQANDDWWGKLDHAGIQQHFISHVCSHHLLNWVHWHRLTSKQACDLLCRHFSPFGVIHQDGNHSEKVSLWEVETYAEFVVDGGYWVSDDVSWETVKPSQDALEQHGFVALYEVINSNESWRLWQKQ